MRDCFADTGRMMGARRGFTLAELLVTLVLSGLLGGVVFSTLVVQLRLARVTAARAADNDAVRTAAVVLAGEVRRSAPADVRALTADSLALRSFRGLALRCVTHDGSIVVRYRGDRLPDPRKDSVLLLTGAMTRAGALVDSRPAPGAPCAVLPGESLLQWSIEASDSAGDQAAADVAMVMLLFESGRYFLAARALRYRLGAEGRQPLTSEAFAHPGTGFKTGSDVGSDTTVDGRSTAVKFELTAGGRAATHHAAPFAPPPHR